MWKKCGSLVDPLWRAVHRKKSLRESLARHGAAGMWTELRLFLRLIRPRGSLEYRFVFESVFSLAYDRPTLRPTHQRPGLPHRGNPARRAALARAGAAEVVLTNHVMGLYELAAIHLSADQPDLASAALAIDAVACLVDGLGDRLGAETSTLRDALANIRLAFVQIKGRAQSATDTSHVQPAG